jgi:YVTN family beta-propeller protein
VVATVKVGSEPIAVAVTRDGRHVYVAIPSQNIVQVINTVTNQLVDFVTVGKFPNDVAVTPDGSHVYVANAGANTVTVIATTTNKVVGKPVPVGVEPEAVGIMPLVSLESGEPRPAPWR